LVDVGGHKLHVVCSGRGVPQVLLESGIAASSVSWAAVQPKVATFTRVCSYDRAGLAWSDPPSCPRTFDRILEELGMVLRAIEPHGSCILVGHSFGSFIVRAYAARHPDRVAGLVLIDPPTEWLVMTSHRARMLRGGRWLSNVGAGLAYLGVVRACLTLLTGGAPALPRGFVRIFGPTAARMLERLVGEVRKLPAEVHPTVQAHWSQPKCFRSMAAHLLTLEREGSRLMSLTPPARIPVRVISSGDQPPDELRAHQQLAECSNQGRHIMATRSTHWVQFDEPELIVSVIRELVTAGFGPSQGHG
jgi:pimeloyl-ACP methyl ester carboxylesterase